MKQFLLVILLAAASQPTNPASEHHFDNFKTSNTGQLPTFASSSALDFGDFESDASMQDISRLLSSTSSVANVFRYGDRVMEQTTNNTIALPTGIEAQLPIDTSAFTELLSGGKQVEDVRQELSNLLFGQSVEGTEVEKGRKALREDDDINLELDGVSVGSFNLTTTGQQINKFEDEFLDYLDFDSTTFDELYYDDPLSTTIGRQENEDNDVVVEGLPTPEKLRQRPPYRRRPVRRQPYRFRHRHGVRGTNSLPPRRNPELHLIPGRIQSLPSRGSTAGGQRKPPRSNGHQSSAPHRLSTPLTEDSTYSGSFSAGHLANPSSDCDYYTDSLCLEVDNYPVQQIVALLGANRRTGNDLVADVLEQSADDLIDGVSSNQENTYTFSHYFGNRRQDDDSHSHRDFAEEGGFLCPSEIKYAKPKRGKTAQGEWKDIVNVNDYTQTLRMEKCLQPGGTCSYVSHHYKSQCSQVYNYHRLLSWNKARGLHMDIYKVPTCCSCHIMGYSYVYPPLSKGAAKSPPTTVKRAPATRYSRPTRRPSLSSESLDNLIPDFNPQEELQQFMQTIGKDIHDFKKFGQGKRPIRQPQVAGGNSGGRPGLVRQLIDGFAPSRNPGLRTTRLSSTRRQTTDSPPQHALVSRRNQMPVRRRGDSPSGASPAATDMPANKYESITLDGEKGERSGNAVNYGYHPIIDFFQSQTF